ncbi:MAG TPA: hypothetical protein PK843_05550 [bacterium]|nr:hypothetical protein [bacterium]
MRNTTVAAVLFSALLSPVLPQTNTKLESHWASGPCKEICLNDHYAFAAFGGTLAAIDLAANTLTASLNLPKSVNYLALHQQTLYAAAANTGLYAIDITDVRSLRASLCSSDQAGKLIVRDQRLFAAGNKSIQPIFSIMTMATCRGFQH